MYSKIAFLVKQNVGLCSKYTLQENLLELSITVIEPMVLLSDNNN